MSKRVAALQALEIMQAFPSDSFGKEFSNNENYEAVNVAAAVVDLEAQSLNSKDEKTVTSLPRPFGSEENVGQSHDENQSANSTDTDALQPIPSKD